MTKHLLLVIILAITSISGIAKNGFYEFDSVVPETILRLFLQAQKEGRNYPTEQQFKDAGISLDDLEFIRSHVQRRQLVNPKDHLLTNLYNYRKLFMCTPMGNGLHGYHGYPSDELGHSDVYTMWNYTEAFGSWNHGFFQAPGSWVDAAHKNGSRCMSGQMFFESTYGGADDTKWIQLISTKENGEYVYVDPMINALMFFGSDGIVYNWEAHGYTNADVIAFHKALYKKAKERNFLDYNSLIYTNESSLNESNAKYLVGTKDEPVHECFLNYWGGDIADNIDNSQSIAEQFCGGTERVYQGVHILRMDRTWTRLAKPGADKMGLIVWGEHERTHIYDKSEGATPEKWQADYQLMQEHFISGGNGNPANRPSLSGSISATYADKLASFCGMAEFFPERSTIQGKQAFATHFNLGNGNYYYLNGVKQTKGGWYNMAAQDVVPTYRWLIYKAGTTNVNSTIKASFYHTDAYVGGSCLNLKGNAGSEGSDIILYKTQMQLGTEPIAKIATKSLEGNATLSLLLKVDGTWKEYAAGAIGSNWHENTIKLADLGQGTIERIALRIKGNADILVGKIELNDNTVKTPKGIKEILSATTMAEDVDNITLKIHWKVDATPDEYGRCFNEANDIDHFEIVCKTETGDILEVGRTSQWATIVSKVPFAADAETMEIGVRAVSTDLKTKSEIKWFTVNKGTPDEVVDPSDVSGNTGIYDINFNKKTPHTREDRYMMHIGIYSNDGTLQKFPNNDIQSRITKQLYLDATEKALFDVVAGETYTPYIDYSALWMSGYAYIDWDNSGDFDAETGISFDANCKPTREDNCEVVSFSAHNSNNDENTWYKSDGTRFNKSEFPKPNNIKMAPFRVPADIAPGIYRMRFKLDWNSLKPGGNDDPRNLIYQNGGDIIDVLINVHAAEGKLGADAKNGTVEKNGNILTTEMNATAEYGKDLPLTFKPEQNYNITGATVRHGYNLRNEYNYAGDGKYDDNGNRQWWEDKLEFTGESYTIPAKLVNSNLLVIPHFNLPNSINTINVDEKTLSENNIYNLSGQMIRRAGEKTKIPAGVYVVKGCKFVVK